MCKWGDTTPVRVKIAADLSHTGKERWAYKEIDRCLAPLVAELQAAGVNMRASCCGHDKAYALIIAW